ncbi:MAG: hypothetical protein NC177_03460 [Ruminococcus flavefaciens]|nr:hypothetical protein [Ruminococcus flavefaciens]
MKVGDEMLLGEFMSTYGEGEGNDLISIENFFGSCSQEEIMTSEVYESIKGRTIKSWQTIGGGAYPVEICVFLADES